MSCEELRLILHRVRPFLSVSLGDLQQGGWQWTFVLLSLVVTLVLIHTFCGPPPHLPPETQTLFADGRDDRGILAL